MERKLINTYKRIALSNKDLLQLVNGQANVVTYPQLVNVNNLDQILQPYGACFLLYESRPKYGHWCALLKTQDEKGSLIEFFDPYGGFPDSQRKYIEPLFRERSGQSIPHLTWLLYNSPYDLSYNEYQFQKHDKNVRDCGRWCVLRILLKDLSLNQFQQLFYNQYSDDLATLFTMRPNQLKSPF
jgi:hypothetical protein